MDGWQRLVRDYEAGAGIDAGAADLPALAGDRDAWLAATLPVLDLALGSVAAVQRAAARAGAAGALVADGVDPARVAAAFSSERVLRLDGHPVEAFAPLSGFFPTADGWVRTHANYPHHRTRLLALLGLHDGATREELAARLAEASAQEVEDAATAAGAVAVRVRTEDEWRGSEAGRAAAHGPIVRIEARDDALERPPDDAGDGGGGRAAWRPAGGDRPLAGLRDRKSVV